MPGAPDPRRRLAERCEGRISPVCGSGVRGCLGSSESILGTDGFASPCSSTDYGAVLLPTTINRWNGVARRDGVEASQVDEFGRPSFSIPSAMRPNLSRSAWLSAPPNSDEHTAELQSLLS